MPIIGVTAFFDHRKDELPRIKLNEAYVQAVIRAGGIPLLIPVGLQENTLPELFQNWTGLFSPAVEILTPRSTMELLSTTSTASINGAMRSKSPLLKRSSKKRCLSWASAGDLKS